jgi:hypothetical protein
LIRRELEKDSKPLVIPANIIVTNDFPIFSFALLELTFVPAFKLTTAAGYGQLESYNTSALRCLKTKKAFALAIIFLVVTYSRVLRGKSQQRSR